MKRRIARLLPLVLIWQSICPALMADEPLPDEARIRKHVGTLASPEFAGRRGAGGLKAREYLIAEFQRLKLEPLFSGSFSQSIPDTAGGPAVGVNVGAILRGSDPKLRDEWVIVSAHFDHLGTRNGVLYPGADDNASGVAMMLEVGRSLVESDSKPARSLMFIGFDLEEAGLWGSRYFVEHSPAPLEKVSLFITADMIGHSLAGVLDPYVFVMGSENAPATRPWVEKASRGSPVRVGQLGSDILVLNRSDYGPFRARKVPYLFFSTGESPVYHSPRDVPETLDYPKAEAISRIIYRVVRAAADAPEAARWVASPENTIDEAVAIKVVIERLLASSGPLKIGGAQVYMMKNAVKTLEGIIDRGKMTPEERTGVVRVARIILFSVL